MTTNANDCSISQPIFLHRNLSYMKDRMSRDHKKRKDFKVDQMLSIVQEKDSTDYEKCKQNFKYMSLMFIGVFNKAMFDQVTMNAEVFLTNNVLRRRMMRGVQPQQVNDSC